MKRSIVVGIAFLALSAPTASALDKVEFGSAVKHTPVYYLPLLAAQEQGIFKKNALEVNWVPSNSGPDFQRNLASGVVQIGASTGPTDILAIAKGAPSVILANLQSNENFSIWVSTAGRINTLQDLKGAQVGVSRLSGTEDSYGKMVANKARIEGMQYTSTGGVQTSMALLVTGRIDAIVLTPMQMIDLKLQGKVKSVADVEDYKPRPWIASTITASRDFVNKQPDVARRVVASILEANTFIRSAAGKPWAIEKMKKEGGYSEAAATALYDIMTLSTDGKFDSHAVKNVVDFMLEYNLLKAGEVPNIDVLFTRQFIS